MDHIGITRTARRWRRIAAIGASAVIAAFASAANARLVYERLQDLAPHDLGGTRRRQGCAPARLRRLAEDLARRAAGCTSQASERSGATQTAAPFGSPSSHTTPSPSTSSTKYTKQRVTDPRRPRARRSATASSADRRTPAQTPALARGDPIRRDSRDLDRQIAHIPRQPNPSLTPTTAPHQQDPDADCRADDSVDGAVPESTGARIAQGTTAGYPNPQPGQLGVARADSVSPMRSLKASADGRPATGMEAARGTGRPPLPLADPEAEERSRATVRPLIVRFRTARGRGSERRCRGLRRVCPRIGGPLWDSRGQRRRSPIDRCSVSIIGALCSKNESVEFLPIQERGTGILSGTTPLLLGGGRTRCSSGRRVLSVKKACDQTKTRRPARGHIRSCDRAGRQPARREERDAGPFQRLCCP